MKILARLVFVSIFLLLLGFLGAWLLDARGLAAPARALQGGRQVFLPIIRNPAPGPPPPSGTRRVNAPKFSGQIRLSEMAVFWFGEVSPNDNYADTRVGYNSDELYIDLNIIDQFIWYDYSPAPTNLTEYDAVTVLINLDGTQGSAPGPNAYRFEGQFRSWESPAPYQAAYRGDGSDWQPMGVSFSTETWYRGSYGGPNTNTENDGWVMEMRIPFSSLGLTGPPAKGTNWALAVLLHDRDTAGPGSIPDKNWPESINPDRPDSWGELVFGLPQFLPSSAQPNGSVVMRHGINGVTVKDVSVGGYTTCGQGLDYWTQWGNTNYGGDQEANVQNQRDIADWPCFSKFLLTFPTSQIPPGKSIISASLTLTQFGSGNPSTAEPSFIQVLSIGEAWNEATITWNNAPLAVENFSGGIWVDPLAFPGWDNVPSHTWDVSLPVYQAYQAGTPIRLVLYSADDAYHSGRYFLTSETGDWLAQARPALEVIWGEP